MKNWMMAFPPGRAVLEEKRRGRGPVLVGVVRGNATAKEPFSFAMSGEAREGEKTGAGREKPTTQWNSRVIFTDAAADTEPRHP